MKGAAGPTGFEGCTPDRSGDKTCRFAGAQWRLGLLRGTGSIDPKETQSRLGLVGMFLPRGAQQPASVQVLLRYYQKHASGQEAPPGISSAGTPTQVEGWPNSCRGNIQSGS